MCEEFSPAELTKWLQEGEQHFKEGNHSKGIILFEKALKNGVKDSFLLASIYRLLGNAYFCLKNYQKARECHQYDLDFAALNNDLCGEARACYNLCITFKTLGLFDEAFLCCNRHLEILSKIGDEEGLALAYYNKGNLHYAWARKVCQLNAVSPGNCSDDVEECLKEALYCYKLNLKITKRLKIDVLQGNCLGNIANVYYLLGQFDMAKRYQLERLKVASDIKDVEGMRRAHVNLGNCFVFLEQFSSAMRHYQQSCDLSREMGDQMLESRSSFNVGNVHSLLNNFPLALEHFRSHLKVAQQFQDEIDEARCWWSLSEAYERTGDTPNAVKCKENYLRLSEKDKSHPTAGDGVIKLRKPWFWLPKAPDCFRGTPEQQNSPRKGSSDDFCSMLFKMQTSRLDDQRHPLYLSPVLKTNFPKQRRFGALNCTLKNCEIPGSSVNAGKIEDFVDKIADFQKSRMDSQRSLAPTRRHLFTSTPKKSVVDRSVEESLSSFLHDLQRSRMDDQRTDAPRLKKSKRRQRSKRQNISMRR